MVMQHKKCVVFAKDFGPLNALVSTGHEYCGHIQAFPKQTRGHPVDIEALLYQNRTSDVLGTSIIWMGVRGGGSRWSNNQKGKTNTQLIPTMLLTKL